MSRLKFILTGLMVFCCQSVAVGEAVTESEHLAEETSGLFAGGMWTAFWSLLVFIVLLIALGKFAWKPLLAALKKREDSIRDDLSSAKLKRTEAEKSLEDLKRQLAAVDEKSKAILKESKEEADKIREMIIAQAQAEVTETLQDARVQLDQAKREAMKELYAESVSLAGELAAKILRREVNNEDHRLLIEDGLNELNSEEKA